MISKANTSEKGTPPTVSDRAVSCPACDDCLSEFWGSDRGFDIQRCSTCHSTFFARPITLQNDYGDYYPYLRIFSKKRILQERGIRRRQALKKLDTISAGLGHRPHTLLDIGSGPGYFASLMSEQGVKADCVELNLDARRVAEALFSLRVYALDKVIEDAYDAVTMFHVLEHIEDPLEMLLRAKTALRPGGLVMLHVPKSVTTADELNWAVRRLVNKKAERRGCLYLPDHLTGFTVEGLQNLAIRAGLSSTKVVSISKFDPEYDPALWIFNLKSPKYWAQETRQMIKGALDGLLDGGGWLRLTAKKV
jgi:SAM-dependent methyltransferase